MKLILPYLSMAQKHENFVAKQMDDAVRDALRLSEHHPCYLEASDDTQQCFLFFREKQIYGSGRIKNLQFSETTIKEFFMTANQMNSPVVACYELNAKLLHSTLILFQKKPSLKLLTSLVDLDEVLDKIEDDKKSCLVCASQGAFLAILRYEKGNVSALCHEHSQATPQERNFREDFLVKIYTLSAEKPLEITIYEDLLVKYASDAKMLDGVSHEHITDMYLSKPPTVTLVFKNKEMGHWILDKPVLNIGRTADNDIVIDNLAVSRLHAVLEKEKGEHFVRDCDSVNGTLVNNNRVGRAKIKDGDRISIGKHTLVVRNQSGIDMVAPPNDVGFDQTVIITPGQRPPNMTGHPGSSHGPKLVEKTKAGDVVIELSRDSVILGKDESADIPVRGMFIADHHAEIVQQNGDYVLRHLNGFRKVSVDGKTIKERILRNNDAIKIGGKEFIFQE